MARAGIYKSEVVRARQTLLAQGRYPSIDAVRIELGNTGSKATIHRYLKEIEEEEGGNTGAKVAVSEALQDLVGRLSARVQEEADARIAEATSRHAAEIGERDATMKAAQLEADGLRRRLERLEVDLGAERAAHGETSSKLQHAVLESAQRGQRMADLDTQLAQAEKFRTSLEEKHENARAALEHFRAAAREQRERENQQHDQQVSALQLELRRAQDAIAIAQSEAMESKQTAASLRAELENSARLLQDREARIAALQKDAEQLPLLRATVDGLRRDIEERDRRLSATLAREQRHESERVEQAARVIALEQQIVAADAKISAQEVIAADLRELLALRIQGASGAPARGRAHASRRGLQGQTGNTENDLLDQ